MAIPATSCPFCAKIVPTDSIESHFKEHNGPSYSNETDAGALDSGLDGYD